MNAQAQGLLLLQDLDLLLLDFGEARTLAEERRHGFEVGNLLLLREERERLAGRLDPALLERYAQTRRRHAKAVVPARGGICMGCFVRRPAMTGGRHSADIETCERCGRLLFWLEAPPPEPAAPTRARRRG